MGCDHEGDLYAVNHTTQLTIKITTSTFSCLHPILSFSPQAICLTFPPKTIPNVSNFSQFSALLQI